MNLSVWIGWDQRETAAYAVARHSAMRRLTQSSIPVRGVILPKLQADGLYTRPIESRDGPAGAKIMWDLISDAPQSTAHANARFLVPHLAKSGWALFMDCDVLIRGNICRVFEGLDRTKAVYCVKHRHEPADGVKMDGQIQTQYARKNWSSFTIFNCDHDANRALTVEMVNTLPGRDLHRFSWLDDEQIGELGTEWNWLVGYSEPIPDPKVVHFTAGLPDMPGHENDPYADEWRAELLRWAA